MQVERAESLGSNWWHLWNSANEWQTKPNETNGDRERHKANGCARRSSTRVTRQAENYPGTTPARYFGQSYGTEYFGTAGGNSKTTAKKRPGMKPMTTTTTTMTNFS
jgi:hypothetical protein